MDQIITPIKEGLVSLKDSLLTSLPQFVIGLIIILITWVVISIIKNAMNRIFARMNMRPSLQTVIIRLTSIAVWVFGIAIAFIVIFESFELGDALATLGFGSIAIGFVFKDIFENFIAGIFILWQVPFEENDYIECEGLEGYVIDIKLRYTYLRQVDRECIVVPNSMLFMNPVFIKTEWKIRRVTVICGVAYGEDVDESREVIRKALEGLPSISDQKPVEIFAQEFADSSINFEVTWWTGSMPTQIRESRDEVVAAVKRALDNAGIEIPFPYRTLTFKGDYPLHMAKNKNGDGEEEATTEDTDSTEK